MQLLSGCALSQPLVSLQTEQDMKLENVSWLLPANPVFSPRLLLLERGQEILGSPIKSRCAAHATPPSPDSVLGLLLDLEVSVLVPSTLTVTKFRIASLMISATDLARGGGNALQTSMYCDSTDPKNTKSSGKPCNRAISRTVRRSCRSNFMDVREGEQVQSDGERSNLPG